jgi:hypothetical protein
MSVPMLPYKAHLRQNVWRILHPGLFFTRYETYNRSSGFLQDPLYAISSFLRPLLHRYGHCFCLTTKLTHGISTTLSVYLIIIPIDAPGSGRYHPAEIARGPP